jgi:Asp-tRNA(Asn)/Glu-tRNA(Gln) amidotransferase A subunit family amidase
VTGRAPFGRHPFAAFRSAYREKARTPSDVTDACLAAIRASDELDPPQRAVITSLDERARRDAEASTARWELGAPRSPLDGIPLVVKDNLNVAGVRTTNGTVLDFPLPRHDAWVIGRLREAGAIVVGKANLHEIGAGTTGINPHHGTPRNPFDPSRWCGGSSSGCASAVGSGLVPGAVGTDAGGSIRMPAAFVGAVGLKPTFGRVSRVGMSVLCDTVDHIGPITATCADALSFLIAMAGVNPADEETWDQEAMPGYEQAEAELARPIAGLRVGVVRDVFTAPWIDEPVARAVSGAADMLRDAGAELVEVSVPDLDESRVVGLLILGAEGPSGLEYYLETHAAKLGADLQVLLAIGGNISARDYLKAQRVRHRIREAWARLYENVDLVLMPAAGTTAGVIHSDALLTGEIDERKSIKAVSYTFPANLTGFPAISVPCGIIEGLPVSAQLIAPPWEEVRCVRAAAAIEAVAPLSPGPLPRHFADHLL